MNRVLLSGRLVADPELRYTPSGKAVASYRLAVDRPFKSDGEQKADFLNCVAWGKTGEFAGNHLHKGMKIIVEGRIQTGSYEKDGVKHYTTDIVVERHEFCESRSGGSSGQSAPAAQGGYGGTSPTFTEMDDDGDLPF